MQQQITSAATGIGTYLMTIAALGTVAFAAAEGLGGKIKAAVGRKGPIKLWIAMSTGTLAGIAGYGAGFLPTPVTGAWAWIFAAIMGFLSAFASKAMADMRNKLRSSTKKRLP